MKLPYKCEHCGKTIDHYRGCDCQPRVTDSCGLDPDIVIEGVKFHHVTRRGNILCERKTEPTPMAAYRYSAN